MELVKVEKKNTKTADLSPIVLRQTLASRLVFKPMLTVSDVDRTKPLKGLFVYQRVGENGWEDVNTTNWNDLKDGEGFKIELNTEAVHRLKEWFDRLYLIFNKRDRLPVRGSEITLDPSPPPAGLYDVEAAYRGDTLNDPALADVVGRAMAEGRSTEVANALALFLDSPDAMKLVESLKRLDVRSVEQVNTLAGVTRMEAALERWEAARRGPGESTDEGFWQTMLAKDHFVLSQVFSYPVVVIREAAYIGGTAINRKGYGLVDFLARNRLTNVLLIEIKTPATSLLERYRNVWGPGHELAGAVAQVANYKQSLLTHYPTLRDDDDFAEEPVEHYDAFDPRCVVIAGDTEQFGEDRRKRKGFELYRNGLRGVDVITYDELFEKTRVLVDLLKQNAGVLVSEGEGGSPSL